LKKARVQVSISVRVGLDVPGEVGEATGGPADPSRARISKGYWATRLEK